MTTAGVLLAAGRSRRFGEADKLLALLNGEPLVFHAAKALRAIRPDISIIVTSDETIASLVNDFLVVRPEQKQPALADSIRAGIAFAQSKGAKRALVLLADMPFVTPRLLHEVASRSNQLTPAAATDGAHAIPPACFPSAMFPQILQLEGDQGAKKLLGNLSSGSLVKATEHELFDVDTIEDLDAANRNAQKMRYDPISNLILRNGSK